MSSYFEFGLYPEIDQILRYPAHDEVAIPKDAIPHPLEIGFELSVGEPHGQVADYRIELSDGRGLHVRETRGFWRIHWDHVFPSAKRWLEHLREDAPFWFGVLVAGIALALVLIVWAVLNLAHRADKQ